MLSLLIIFLSLHSPSWAQSAQHRLYQDLLQGYNPLFIPILTTNTTNTTQQVQRVFIEANLQKIIDVEPRKGVLTSLIWLDLAWEDDYLKWDPEEYGGLTRLELPPSKIWTPDIFH